MAAMPSEPPQRRPMQIPLPVAWAIGVFLTGLVFQAGMAWQLLLTVNSKLAGIEASQPAIGVIREELSGMRADIRNLTGQVTQLNRTVYRQPGGAEEP